MIESWITGFMLAAPFLILAAAFFDTLIFTGYFLYGFAMLSSVSVLHMNGALSAPEIVLFAWTGTSFASCTNFLLGHLGGVATQQRAKRLLTGKLSRQIPYLQGKHLWLTILIGRSITLTRPAYAFLLGVSHANPIRFVLFEVCISLLWVTFWVYIILLGESLIQKII